MKRKSLLATLIIFTILLSGLEVSGQGDQDHSHDDNHKHEHKNEISIASGIVIIPSENEIGTSLHLHYIRGLGAKKIVGIGGGVEVIIEAHKHITFSAILQYRIIKGLTAGYSPGLLILIEEIGSEIQFAQHLELGYEFEIGSVHLGPVFELGIEKEVLHYMSGVHLGIDF
jgi:hypothetical protein